jgi:hypothetical protein
MKETVQAELRTLGSKQATEVDAIPDDLSLMEIADRVVRGKLKLGAQQMRLLIELLPYHAPKLMAVANMTEGSFGKLLDAAIERSNGPLKLIEARPIPAEPEEPIEHDASEMKGPFKKLERY